MRTKIKIDHTSDVLGHSYSFDLERDHVALAQGLENDWSALNRTRLSKYFWFRAPLITQEQLADTVRGLANLEKPFVFEIWQNEAKLDASLKISDDNDAALWAWGYAHYWQKWSKEAEKEFKNDHQRKPQKMKVNKDGTVRVKVQVSTIQDP
jgi:hypothetical protein